MEISGEDINSVNGFLGRSSVSLVRDIYIVQSPVRFIRSMKPEDKASTELALTFSSLKDRRERRYEKDGSCNSQVWLLQFTRVYS